MVTDGVSATHTSSQISTPKVKSGISTQEKSSFAPNGNAYSGWLRSVRISVGVPASGPGVKWRAS